MHRIGPFAERKEEGAPAVKSDGSYEYECVNDQCSEHKKLVTISAEEEATFEEAMAKVCQCGHVRGVHGFSLSSREDGEAPSPRKLDGECSATDCECNVYTFQTN